MSWPLMEKLLRHQQSVRSSEGCCVDRLNSPPDNNQTGKLPGHLKRGQQRTFDRSELRGYRNIPQLNL